MFAQCLPGGGTDGTQCQQEYRAEARRRSSAPHRPTRHWCQDQVTGLVRARAPRLSSRCLVCRPSLLCVCRVGTPPARKYIYNEEGLRRLCPRIVFLSWARLAPRGALIYIRGLVRVIYSSNWLAIYLKLSIMRARIFRELIVLARAARGSAAQRPGGGRSCFAARIAVESENQKKHSKVPT